MDSYAKIFKDTLPQFIASLAMTIGLISDGMAYGWTSPSVPILESKESPLPSFRPENVVWLENLCSVGSLVAIPFTIWSVNNYGRRDSMMVFNLVKILGWFMISFSNSLESMLIGRFLNGFAINGTLVSVPMYISEIADKKIRGLLLSFVYIFILIGLIVMYSIGSNLDITCTAWVAVWIVFIQLFMLPFLPRSPYYLLTKNRKDDARRSMLWLEKKSSTLIEEELQNLDEMVTQELKNKGRIIDLFNTKGNRRATFIMIYLNGSQHCCGITAIVMNVQSILQKASSNMNPSTASIIFAILMLCAACGSSLLVDVLGRRALLLFSSIFTSVSLALLAIYLTVKDSGVNVVGYNWIPVVAIFMYAVAFKLGLGMVPMVMNGELFSTNIRALGMAVADSSFTIFIFLSISMYNVLVLNFNIQTPLYIFAICSFATIFLTFFFIPETKGKSLEEIQLLLNESRLTNFHRRSDYDVLM